MPSKRSRRGRSSGAPQGELETFWTYWMALTPAQRMRRCFVMLQGLKDPDAVHDAKLFPKP